MAEDIIFHPFEFPNNPTLLNSYDKDGYTYLHRALKDYRLNRESLVELLEQGADIFQLTRIPIVKTYDIEDIILQGRGGLNETHYIQMEKIKAERLSVLRYYINYNNEHVPFQDQLPPNDPSSREPIGFDPSSVAFSDLESVGTYLELNVFGVLFKSQYFYHIALTTLINYILSPSFQSKTCNFYMAFKKHQKYVKSRYNVKDTYWLTDYTTGENILMSALAQQSQNIDLIRFIVEKCVNKPHTTKSSFLSSLFSPSTPKSSLEPPKTPKTTTTVTTSTQLKNNDLPQTTPESPQHKYEYINYFNTAITDATQPTLNTALHYAILFKQHVTIVNLILQHHTSAAINLPNASKQLPLFMAISSKQWESAISIIIKGANVNIPDQHGRLALHIALKDQTCPDSVLDAILDANAGVYFNPSHPSSRTALMEAVEFNRSSHIINRIIQLGEIQQQEHISSTRSRTSSFSLFNKKIPEKSLLSRFASFNENNHYINYKDKFGMSALAMACSSHYISFNSIQTLIEYQSGEVGINSPINSPPTDEKKNITRIIDVNSQSIGGWNALTHALRAKGGMEIIHYLLEAGVNPNCFDSDHHTPFIVALQYHCTIDILKLFLAHGSDLYQYYGLPYVPKPQQDQQDEHITWIDNDTNLDNELIAQNNQQQPQQQDNNVAGVSEVTDTNRKLRKLRLFTPIMFIIKKGQLRPDIQLNEEDHCPLEDALELFLETVCDDLINGNDKVECLTFLERNICFDEKPVTSKHQAPEDIPVTTSVKQPTPTQTPLNDFD